MPRRRSSLRRRSRPGGVRIRSRTPRPYNFRGDVAIPRRPREEVKSTSLGAGGQVVYDGVAGQFLVDLTNVTQGVSGAQRAGDHLFAQHLQLRLLMWNNTGVTSNLQCCWRVFVFQYLGDSSVAAKPIISDLLQINAANAGNTYGSFSNFDIDYDRQYVLLYDSSLVQTVGNHGLAITGVPSLGEWQTMTPSIRLRCDRNIAYYTGGITGPNHIFMLVTTDSANIASNPLLVWSSEFRFVDS